MWKKALAALIVAGVGYGVYAHYTGPFHDAPDLHEDDFLLAFKGEGALALKGVMRGFGSRDRDRTYMSVSANNVPKWYFDTWSICRTPTESEASSFFSNVDTGPGGRLEAVCEIDADGDIFIRGWIASAPKL